MELVEQDRGLRSVLPGCSAKRFPHVHDRQANRLGLLRPQGVVELKHAGLGSVDAAKPDRPFADQVADDDAVGMPLADRDFVDADPSPLAKNAQ
jgi:hypothetical protein